MLTLLVVAALLVLFLPLVVFAVLALLDEKRPLEFPTLVQSRGGITVRVYYRSRLALLLQFLTGGRLYGLPLWSRVYFADRRNNLPSTALTHELAHVDQWHGLGLFNGFMLYAGGLLRHGYVWHPMEIHARTYAGESLGTV